MKKIDYDKAKEADKLLDDSYVDYILIYQKDNKEHHVTLLMNEELDGVKALLTAICKKEKDFGTSKQRMEEDLHDIVNNVIKNIFKEVQ